MSRLLTLPEAAEMLRRPVNTLRHWRFAGTGPTSFRMGRRVMYREEDLIAWVEAQRQAEQVAA
ncbi:helix-turn-helix domain-containing protein [Streptomyces sp. NPDC048551]|uniref:helix-turn-helix transcriptional regulator n=1 Tax=Streptomyces sp. NPDC048551 TaxID=3155758 RepID=UPI00342677B5